MNEKKPVLIVMAAGMGSRYGGLKQIDPVDEYGHMLLDYSIYDAKKAGFEDVIFIIKKADEEDFKRLVTSRLDGVINYELAYQDINDVPEGFTAPAERTKPWGTAHAVRAARKLLNGRPFAAINSDDYYGTKGFSLIYDFMVNAKEGEYAMCGYMVGNTVTENGSVARGVCAADGDGYLTEITERTRIEKRPGGAAFTEDDGATWTFLPADTIVSMNFWAFTPDFMDRIDEGFADFLEKNLPVNPLKCEYFLPFVVEDQLKAGNAKVKVLKSDDKWYGVTYREDKPTVVAALAALREAGVYDFKA